MVGGNPMANLRQAKKHESERAQIENRIINYYDRLTEKDVEEERAWGHFAETQLGDD
jgi:hypothetical protein